MINTKKDIYYYKGYIFIKNIDNPQKLRVYKNGVFKASVVFKKGRLSLYYGKDKKLIFQFNKTRYDDPFYKSKMELRSILTDVIRHIKEYEKDGYTFIGIDTRYLNELLNEILEKLDKGEYDK